MDHTNNTNNEDPYATLNVSRQATTAQIQQSYKKLSRAFHPDKQASSIRTINTANADSSTTTSTSLLDDAQLIFIRFKNAYDILMDPALRLAYDCYGHEGLNFVKKSMLVKNNRGDDHQDYDDDNDDDYSSTSRNNKEQDDNSRNQNIEDDDEYDDENYLNDETQKHLLVYSTITKLIANNQKQRAEDVLAQAMQFENYQTNKLLSNQVSGGVQVKCTTLHSTTLLGEGMEVPLRILDGLDVEKTMVNFSVTCPAIQQHPSSHHNLTKNRKQFLFTQPWSLTFGGGGTIAHTGLGRSQGQLSLGYEPMQGTDVHIDLEVDSDDNHKVTIGSSRFMSDRTYITTSLSTIPKSKGDLAFSISSHRSMFQNKVQGTFIMGVGFPTLPFHYSLISFTTYYPSYPICTFKFNLGIDKCPFRLVVKDSFKSKQSSSLSKSRRQSVKGVHNTTKSKRGSNPTKQWELDFGFGSLNPSTGKLLIDVKFSTTRSLTKYCKFTLGLHHLSSRGLTWLFRISRGGLSFTVPIWISPITTNGYPLKSLYMMMFTTLLDASLSEILDIVKSHSKSSSSTDSRSIIISKESQNESNFFSFFTRQPHTMMVNKRDIELMEREKMKRDALLQHQLMSKPAAKKRQIEEEKEIKGLGGLVIIKATYGMDGGDVMDVTTALQFWVTDASTLHLPPVTKRSMLGFYDVGYGVVGDFCGSDSRILDGMYYVRLLKNVWNKGTNLLLNQTNNDESNLVKEKDDALKPYLTVRYRHANHLYEISILDDEELSLPSQDAMCLGGSNVF